MEYKVAVGSSEYLSDAIQELEREVKRLTMSGWKPQGGVTIGTHDYRYYQVIQAMIKP